MTRRRMPDLHDAVGEARDTRFRRAVAQAASGRLSRSPGRRISMDGIVQIVVIVLIVLFVVGYFGKGRFRI